MIEKMMIPPHQDGNDEDWYEKGDSGGYFPTPESIEKYTNAANEIYHENRIKSLQYLLKTIEHIEFDTILDFGIGEGRVNRSLNINTKEIIGIDISNPMLDLAKNTLRDFNFHGYNGGVETLSKIADESIDLILCINTLGYLAEFDRELFFIEAKRVVKPSGHLLIMAGNELFDLFALNSGTVDFFQKYFTEYDTSELLTHGKSDRFKNAYRENPLSIGHELHKHGFLELKQSFSQWHKMPPPIAVKEANGNLRAARTAMRDLTFDANLLPDTEKWKALFLCSIFASLSKKVSK